MVNRNQRSSSEESGQVPDQAIREQLDDLYRALTGHPMVKVVL